MPACAKLAVDPTTQVPANTAAKIRFMVVLLALFCSQLERVPFALTRSRAETRSRFPCVVAFSSENRKSTFPENALASGSGMTLTLRPRYRGSIQSQEEH